ncbi:MAG: hypothetical protein K2L50_01810 [Bacteroidales bacterium]|nr:hypothetical protein [Bacteroidales bacterium]
MKYVLPVLTLAAGFLAGRLIETKQKPEEADKGMSAIFWVVVVVAVVGVGLGMVYTVKQLIK